MNAQTELPDDGPGTLLLSCNCRAASVRPPESGDLYDLGPEQCELSTEPIEIALFATELLSRHVTAFRFGLVGLGVVAAEHSTVIRVRVDGLCDWVELHLQTVSWTSSRLHPSLLSFSERAHESIRMVLVDAQTRRVKLTRPLLISRQLARSLRACRTHAPVAAIVEFCAPPPQH